MRCSIESQRLRLRNFTLADTEAYFEMTQDQDIRRYVPYCFSRSFKGTRELIKDYIRGDCIHDFYLLLEEKESKQIVGAIIATTNRFFTQLDVAIMTKTSFRNQGYMKEALDAFIAYLPKDTVLSFVVEQSNTSSLNTIGHIKGIEETTSQTHPEKRDHIRSFRYVV